MKKYQVQSMLGFVYGIYEAGSPISALDKVAKDHGYGDWLDWCEKLELLPDFKVTENKIII